MFKTAHKLKSWRSSLINCSQLHFELFCFWTLVSVPKNNLWLEETETFRVSFKFCLTSRSIKDSRAQRSYEGIMSIHFRHISCIFFNKLLSGGDRPRPCRRVGRPHASPDTKLINCLCTALFLFFYGLKWIKKTVELRGLIYFLSTSQTSPEPDVSTLWQSCLYAAESESSPSRSIVLFCRLAGKRSPSL